MAGRDLFIPFLEVTLPTFELENCQEQHISEGKTPKKHTLVTSYYWVAGWTNPFEKYLSISIISPARGKNNSYLKPPPSALANGI